MMTGGVCGTRLRKTKEGRHGNSFIDVQRLKAPFDHDSLHSFGGFLSNENMQNIRCAPLNYDEKFVIFFINTAAPTIHRLYRFDVIENI